MATGFWDDICVILLHSAGMGHVVRALATDMTHPALPRTPVGPRCGQTDEQQARKR